MPREAAAELIADLGFIARCDHPGAGANSGRAGSGKQACGTGRTGHTDHTGGCGGQAGSDNQTGKRNYHSCTGCNGGTSGNGCTGGNA